MKFCPLGRIKKQSLGELYPTLSYQMWSLLDFNIVKIYFVHCLGECLVFIRTASTPEVTSSIYPGATLASLPSLLSDIRTGRQYSDYGNITAHRPSWCLCRSFAEFLLLDIRDCIVETQAFRVVHH